MDAINFTIDEEGKISIDIDQLTKRNQIAADNLLEEIHSAMGGERTANTKCKKATIQIDVRAHAGQ